MLNRVRRVYSKNFRGWTVRRCLLVLDIDMSISIRLVHGSMGTMLSSRPSNLKCDALVLVILLTMTHKGILFKTTIEFDSTGGSSGRRTMSTISPRAPFVMSRSVAMLFVTSTLIPLASSILLGSRALVVLLAFLRQARAKFPRVVLFGSWLAPDSRRKLQ
jgi:hypothetical protein